MAEGANRCDEGAERKKPEQRRRGKDRMRNQNGVLLFGSDLKGLQPADEKDSEYLMVWR